MFRRELSTKQMAVLCRSLATTCGRGIPIGKCLDLLAGTRRGCVGVAALRVSDGIRRGATLREALRAQQGVFPEFFVEMVSCAEIAGAEETVFAELAEYYEKGLRANRAIIQMLTYPMLLVVVATVILPFVRGYAILAFGNNGAGTGFLPYSWRFLLGWVPMIVEIALLVIVYRVLRRFGVIQKVSAVIGVYFWPLSSVVRKLAMARFYRAVAILLRSGLGLARSIERAAAVTVNPLIRKELVLVAPRVQQGLTLAEALNESSFVTRLDLALIETGEQTGKLDETMLKLSEYLIDEIRSPMNIVKVVVGASFVFCLVFALLARIVAVVCALFRLLSQGVAG